MLRRNFLKQSSISCIVLATSINLKSNNYGTLKIEKKEQVLLLSI